MFLRLFLTDAVRSLALIIVAMALILGLLPALIEAARLASPA